MTHPLLLASNQMNHPQVLAGNNMTHPKLQVFANNIFCSNVAFYNTNIKYISNCYILKILDLYLMKGKYMHAVTPY
jgi:hypothetical protein